MRYEPWPRPIPRCKRRTLRQDRSSAAFYTKNEINLQTTPADQKLDDRSGISGPKAAKGKRRCVGCLRAVRHRIGSRAPPAPGETPERRAMSGTAGLADAPLALRNAHPFGGFKVIFRSDFSRTNPSEGRSCISNPEADPRRARASALSITGMSQAQMLARQVLIAKVPRWRTADTSQTCHPDQSLEASHLGKSPFKTH